MFSELNYIKQAIADPVFWYGCLCVAVGIFIGTIIGLVKDCAKSANNKH